MMSPTVATVCILFAKLLTILIKLQNNTSGLTNITFFV